MSAIDERSIDAAEPCPALAIGDQHLLVFGGFVLALVLYVVYRPWDLANAFMIGAPFGRDFANFWAGGHLALAGRLDLLADFAGYNQFLAATFHHDPTDQLVFSYPPHILMFLVPFGAMPFGPAVLAWSALNVVLIERSVRLLAGTGAMRIAACLSPAVVTMVAYGHFGGVLAFLAIFGLTRADTRPVLAGVCLALMSVKPQFAVVLGISLLLIGRWRVVLWSLPITVGLVGISVGAFGLKPWVNFVEWTLPFHAQAIASYAHEALKTTASVYAATRLAGVPAWAAFATQYAFSAVVLVGAALLVRRQGMTPRTVATALFAALAALPYFQNYDLAIVVPALTVALLDRSPPGHRAYMPLVPAGLLWLAPAFALPFGMLALPVVPVIVAGTLLAVLWREGADARIASASPVPSCPGA